MNTFFFFLHNIAIGTALLGALAYKKEMLIALVCVMGILSNLFLVKQIDLFGYSVTSTDVFAVGMCIGLNLIQEYWGKSTAKKTILISFLCSLFYLCMTQFHLSYIPNVYDKTAQAFETILCFAPRFVCASFVSFFISQYFECFIFAQLKEISAGRHFILRNYVALILSQLLDTIIFSFLGLYKIAGNILHIIMVSFFIKLVIIICSTPIIAGAKFVVPTKNQYE